MLPLALAGIAGVQAISGYMSAKAAGAQARAAAQYNAQQSMASGLANATNTEHFAEYNANTVLSSANTNSEIIRKVANHNAKVQTMVAEYNTSLLEGTIGQVLSDAELDLNQFTKGRMQQIGHQTAVYAASGIMLGDGQSLDTAIIDARTELDMDRLIMSRNVEATVGKLKDEQAKGTWQGQVAAQQLMFEGEVNAFNTLNDATTKANTIIKQGYYDASNQRYGATVNANSSLYTGAQQSAQMDTKANQALLDGMFKGASVYTSGSSTTSPVASSTDLQFNFGAGAP